MSDAAIQGAGFDLRHYLRRQREEGIGLREALTPTYDKDWTASWIIAWTAAEGQLEQAPGDELAQEIRDLALGCIRFALGLALTLRTPDGAVFCPAQRAKQIETTPGWERGLTLLAHWWESVKRPHRELIRHTSAQWLGNRDGHRLLWHILSPELRRAIKRAGGPTLQGRLSHPLYWRRDGDLLDAWAPWLHLRSESGGAHGKQGGWAVLGWEASSRDDAYLVGRLEGSPVPAGGKVEHPTRGVLGAAGLALGGWNYVGPDSEPFPLAASHSPPPVEEGEPAPEIDPGSLDAPDFDALTGPLKRSALQAIFAVAEHGGPDRIVRVRDRLAAHIARRRAESGV